MLREADTARLRLVLIADPVGKVLVCGLLAKPLSEQLLSHPRLVVCNNVADALAYSDLRAVIFTDSQSPETIGEIKKRFGGVEIVFSVHGNGAEDEEPSIPLVRALAMILSHAGSEAESGGEIDDAAAYCGEDMDGNGDTDTDYVAEYRVPDGYPGDPRCFEQGPFRVAPDDEGKLADARRAFAAESIEGFVAEHGDFSATDMCRERRRLFEFAREKRIKVDLVDLELALTAVRYKIWCVLGVCAIAVEQPAAYESKYAPLPQQSSDRAPLPLQGNHPMPRGSVGGVPLRDFLMSCNPNFDADPVKNEIDRLHKLAAKAGYSQKRQSVDIAFRELRQSSRARRLASRASRETSTKSDEGSTAVLGDLAAEIETLESALEANLAALRSLRKKVNELQKTAAEAAS